MLRQLNVKDVDVTLLCVSRRRIVALSATKSSFTTTPIKIRMIVLTTKILKILLAFLVGYQVKNAFYRYLCQYICNISKNSERFSVKFVFGRNDFSLFIKSALFYH